MYRMRIHAVSVPGIRGGNLGLAQRANPFSSPKRVGRVGIFSP